VLYILGTLAVLAFMIGVLVLVGHFYPGSSADLVDWKPTRSPEVEAQNEIDASGGVQGGRGMATAGFVLGIIALVAWVLIVILYVVVLGVAASSNA